MRRKCDIKNQELHEKLWDKWQLESLEFFDGRSSQTGVNIDRYDVPHLDVNIDADDITYYGYFPKAA